VQQKILQRQVAKAFKYKDTAKDGSLHLEKWRQINAKFNEEFPADICSKLGYKCTYFLVNRMIGYYQNIKRFKKLRKQNEVIETFRQSQLYLTATEVEITRLLALDDAQLSSTKLDFTFLYSEYDQQQQELRRAKNILININSQIID
jgi:hypothetical protein